MEGFNNQEDSDNTTLHIDAQECDCEECQNKQRYVQIIDVDRYIDDLNDWD